MYVYLIRHTELHFQFVQQSRQFLLHLLLQRRFLFLYPLAPYEGITVRVRFQLRSVDKHCCHGNLAHLYQQVYHLTQYLLSHPGKMLRPKSCYRVMVRCLVSVQQEHIDDVLPAGCFYHAAAVRIVHVPIHQQFCEDPRRIPDSPIPGVTRFKYAPIHPFHHSVQYPYLVARGNVYLDVQRTALTREKKNRKTSQFAVVCAIITQLSHKESRADALVCLG